MLPFIILKTKKIEKNMKVKFPIIFSELKDFERSSVHKFCKFSSYIFRSQQDLSNTGSTNHKTFQYLLSPQIFQWYLTVIWNKYQPKIMVSKIVITTRIMAPMASLAMRINKTPKTTEHKQPMMYMILVNPTTLPVFS